MRLFIAIELPPSETRCIARALAPMRAAAPAVAWVAEPLLHLTLKFLGERPPEVVEGLEAWLRVVAESHVPLSLELGGLGAFPDLREPKIIWLGITPEPRLELLHHDVESACARLGYPLDVRAFRPHITVGRVKHSLGGDAARRLRSAAQSVDLRRTVAADAVHLMASSLTPQGPRYTRLAALPLGER